MSQSINSILYSIYNRFLLVADIPDPLRIDPPELLRSAALPWVEDRGVSDGDPIVTCTGFLLPTTVLVNREFEMATTAENSRNGMLFAGSMVSGVASLALRINNGNTMENTQPLTK